MMEAHARIYNNKGTYKLRFCYVVRILHADKKVLVRFPGNARTYVKARDHVEIITKGRFAGGKSG